MSMEISRVGTRAYSATNQRGATLTIGKGEGEWSPGELLQMALLGCNAMSADHRLAGALGEDFKMSAKIEGEYSEAENRYTAFDVELNPEGGAAAQLSAEDLEKTVIRALRAIDRQCTIGRTIDHVVPHESRIEVKP